MNKTLIIAEAGVNHNGDENLAFKLVDAAHDAGADIVKFQTFKANKLVTKHAKQAGYQVQNTGVIESQYDMLKRLELSHETHLRLVAYCNDKGIGFLSTAFDVDSLAFLVADLGLKRLKIPSGEITNLPFVLAHAMTGCDLILSTGMCDLADIEVALSVIAFGYTQHNDSEPSLQAFKEAYSSLEGQKALKAKVTLLHCTTEYPAPLDEINLRAMGTLGSAFDLPVGYSDHTEGVVIPVAAVARGALLIEKHFTLDKDMEGPDHKASLSPAELKEMVDGIRAVEMALGSAIKAPTKSEVTNRAVARKSLVAARPIKEGAIIEGDDIAIKRPGTGMAPSRYWSLIDSVASRSYEEGDLFVE